MGWILGTVSFDFTAKWSVRGWHEPIPTCLVTSIYCQRMSRKLLAVPSTGEHVYKPLEIVATLDNNMGCLLYVNMFCLQTLWQTLGKLSAPHPPTPPPPPPFPVERITCQRPSPWSGVARHRQFVPGILRICVGDTSGSVRERLGSVTGSPLLRLEGPGIQGPPLPR